MRSRAEAVTAPVTRTQIVRFAGAAGDFNPMHHDEPFAQGAGEPSVFAMGQLQAAILGAFTARWLGRERITGYGVRFTGKVRPGDRLVLRGTLGEPSAGTRRAELEAVLEDDGTVVVTGWVTVRD